MKASNSIRRAAWIVASLSALSVSLQSVGVVAYASLGPDSHNEHPEFSKFGVLLGDFVAGFQNTQVEPLYSNMLITLDGDKVLVNIVLEPETTTAQVEAIPGVEVRSRFKHVISAAVHMDSLTLVASSSFVRLIQPVLSVKSSGSVLTEGDRAMSSDDARQELSINGAGIKIGILSDSYDCGNAAISAADDVASGDLPSGVQVLQEEEGCISGTDEGRAMMQLAFDVAPGASFAFHTAFGGISVFANGIRALAQAGCDVIVDDVSDLLEPWFQDGLVNQAVEEVVSQGIPFFSCAGNRGQNGWHRDANVDPITFVDTADIPPIRVVNFATDGTVDVRHTVTLESNGEVSIVFQWDAPFASAGGLGCDIDMNIYAYEGKTRLGASRSSNIGGDAVEIMWLTGLPPRITFDILIAKISGDRDPTYLKWIVYDGTIVENEYEIPTPTLVAHHNAANGAGVGAAFYGSSPGFGTGPAVPQDFSSAGGTQILFNTTGNRLATPEIRNQPRFTGPDGGLTTHFGRFFGTSAAAPHVAAVAALMLEKGRLDPDAIYGILEQTSDDMDDTRTPGPDPGFDFGTGFGFVNALEACRVAAERLPPAPAPVTPITGTPICFSSSNTVRVFNKGLVSIEDVQIGDMVETSNGTYSRLYSFAHKDEKSLDQFWRITTSRQTTLEISGRHMVYVNDSLTLAKNVQMGDWLDQTQQVVSVDTVVSRGLYAPLTENGEISVSGVRSSNYVALLDLSEVLQMQFFHACLAPLRCFCRWRSDWCQQEAYTNGVSSRLAWLVPLVETLSNSHWLVQWAFLILLAPIAGGLAVLEVIAVAPIVPMVLIAGWLAQSLRSVITFHARLLPRQTTKA